MSSMLLSLTRAVDKGRGTRPLATRASLLESLLRKRAAAHVHGAGDLEAMLRDQIKWSLPMRKVEAEDRAD